MSDQLLSAACLKAAQAVALAVAHMAAEHAWLDASVAEHQGKMIRVEVLLFGKPLAFSWQVVAGRVFDAKDASLNDVADVTLKLLPSAYAAAAELPFDVSKIMRHVRIEGDVGLAEWVNRLVQELRPDVWSDVALIVGKIPAYYMSQGFESLLLKSKQAAAAFTQRTQHVLFDEAAVLLRHKQLDDFSADAQALRYALERLTQRVALLTEGKK